MKSREEYIASIYTKRDERLLKRKKLISAITAVACLVICFASVFAFVPKKFGHKKTSIAETAHGMNSSESKMFAQFDSTTAVANELFTLVIPYNAPTQSINSTIINNVERNAGAAVTKDNSANIEDGKIQTEIAVEIPDEETTRQVNFGYAGEPFNPDWLINGKPATAPDYPPEDYVTGVSEPYLESPDSVDEATKKSTTAAKLRSSDEAIAEAKKYIPKEDANKIINEKTHVTISRTASGKSTYTVYFYTDIKLFTIELNAVTLEMIECKEKNTNTGDVNYYSPAHFPETTAALPEYKPQ